MVHKLGETEEVSYVFIYGFALLFLVIGTIVTVIAYAASPEDTLPYSTVDCYIIDRSIYLGGENSNWNCRRVTYNCTALAYTEHDPVKQSSRCCRGTCSSYRIAEVEALYPIGAVETGYLYDSNNNSVLEFSWSVPTEKNYYKFHLTLVVCVSIELVTILIVPTILWCICEGVHKITKHKKKNKNKKNKKENKEKTKPSLEQP